MTLLGRAENSGQWGGNRVGAARSQVAATAKLAQPSFCIGGDNTTLFLSGPKLFSTNLLTLYQTYHPSHSMLIFWSRVKKVTI